MSEIKGQLLGIILTLMVFGGVSATIAHVYANSAAKVTDYAENIEEPAADQAGFDIPNSGTYDPNNVAHPAQVSFPGLSY